MAEQNQTFDTFEKTPIEPIKAWRHFKKLIANKEDTEQVFHIIKALNGDSQRKQYQAFSASEMGQTRLDTQVHLPPLLDNHDALKQLPEDSFGRAYVNFMESEGLTAQGLVDEYDRFETGFMDQFPKEVQWYFNRRRDTHDLLHILTGYGRDALGEACVLAYSYAVNKGLGVAFIAYGAGMEVRKTAPKDAKVMRAVYEAYKIGKGTKDILYYDIMELLKRPLEDVRSELGITRPKAYQHAHDVMRANGMDPYEMIAPQTSQNVTSKPSETIAA